ncbi:MAG: hypothetical protein CMN57_12610 [Gammaproteobacteria bacterium]|nr:hypothetical protein [Gammaproteobacteria bacterium]
MNPHASNLNRTLLAGMLTAGLAACGGGGGSDSGATGSFSLSITDAPVDDAQEVVVTFTAVTLKPADGDAITITLDTPQSINLLDYQNGASVTLVDDEAVTAGDYAWIRLTLDQNNTYIVDSLGREHDLTIPSSAQTGLKLNNSFTLAADETLAYTIDFDLRKSVHLTGTGEYIMRPTLRMVKDAEAASLGGSVDSSLIATHCVDAEDIPAVYVFESGDPVDDMDGGNDPVATATIPMDGVYEYKVTLLEPGTYTLAFTCDADQDGPDTDDDAAMTFVGETDVTLTAGATTTHNF